MQFGWLAQTCYAYSKISTIRTVRTHVHYRGAVSERDSTQHITQYRSPLEVDFLLRKISCWLKCCRVAAKTQPHDGQVQSTENSTRSFSHKSKRIIDSSFSKTTTPTNNNNNGCRRNNCQACKLIRIKHCKIMSCGNQPTQQGNAGQVWRLGADVFLFLLFVLSHFYISLLTIDQQRGRLLPCPLGRRQDV